jgi:hypothetical protein
MKHHFIKTLIILFISGIPVSACFADAAIDAKAAEVKARMLRDFAPPRASQHLSNSRSNYSQPTTANGQAPANQQDSYQSAQPSAEQPAPIQAPADSKPGSWYVQPGDSGAKSNGSSGSSSFDHGSLY